MSRDSRVYLEDILGACTKIETYVAGLESGADGLGRHEMALDAVIRNLEIIGEAVKKLPDDVKAAQPDVDWRRIAGLRDILIHAYFGIEPAIVIDVVKHKLGPLKAAVKAILKP
jgi:uncharacterized protein with HEPN domain